MSTRRMQFTAQELAAGSPAHRVASASPDPSGNRAQRRAWAKRAKRKMPPSPSTSEPAAEVEQLTGLGLRVQWAALYDDGTWTSGQDETRAEAEEIIASSPVTPRPVLARRWITGWAREEEA